MNKMLATLVLLISLSLAGIVIAADAPVQDQSVGNTQGVKRNDPPEGPPW